jgi:SAM-dependent methyltransferase
MATLKRIRNIIKYGLGPEAKAKKNADKEKQRKIRFWENKQWQQNTGFAKRQYASYDEYVTHQTAKLDKVLPRLLETETEDFAEFKRRFQDCVPLSEARSILCLGARIGTEVKALHALGYFAVGIDLNPGKDNYYVLPGDFHQIVFPDASIDAIYCNTLDHTFDLAKLIYEVHRLLRPQGLFITDLVQGFEEGWIPGEYEATHWRDANTIIQEIRRLGNFQLDHVRDLGFHRRDRWTQAVFRKTAADQTDDAFV